MTNQEKIAYYKTLSMEELEKTVDDPNISISDMRIASVILGEKQFELGMYYSTDELMESIFGKNKLVRKG